MVREIVWRATGGHPAAMRMCLKFALPVGRGRPLPVRLPPLESPKKQRKAARTIAVAMAHGFLTLREGVQLLEAIEAQGGHIPGIEIVRKHAAIEASIANAAAAMGLDHDLTISEGPVAARAGAIAAARARGWTGEDPTGGLPATYDLTPWVRSNAVMRRLGGGPRPAASAPPPVPQPAPAPDPGLTPGYIFQNFFKHET
jgi:hypothetical protein